MATVDWTWLFVDAPAGRGDASLGFWTVVTGTTPSPSRGDRDPFVTLEPRFGPAWLKHQHTRDGGGVHVDLDVTDPAAAMDRAVAMGATVTATVDVDPDSDAPGHPARVLLQRLDDPGDGVVRGHLDIACRDRAAETARHLDLGASHVADFPFWTVMRDPAGATYCLTDRDPETGTLDLP